MNKGDFLAMGQRVQADAIAAIEAAGGTVDRNVLDLNDSTGKIEPFLGERLMLMGQITYEEEASPGDKQIFCFNFQSRPATMKPNPDYVPPPRPDRPASVVDGKNQPVAE